jgi:hypothetical protein
VLVHLTRVLAFSALPAIIVRLPPVPTLFPSFRLAQTGKSEKGKPSMAKSISFLPHSWQEWCESTLDMKATDGRCMPRVSEIGAVAKVTRDSITLLPEHARHDVTVAWILTVAEKLMGKDDLPHPPDVDLPTDLALLLVAAMVKRHRGKTTADELQAMLGPHLEEALDAVRAVLHASPPRTDRTPPREPKKEPRHVPAAALPHTAFVGDDEEEEEEEAEEEADLEAAAKALFAQSQSKATGKPSKKQAASALSKLLAPSDAKVGGVAKLITLLERAEEPDESVRALLRKVLEVDLKEVTDSECEESCTKSLARAEKKYRRFVKKHNRFLYAPLAAAMPAEDFEASVTKFCLKEEIRNNVRSKRDLAELEERVKGVALCQKPLALGGSAIPATAARALTKSLQFQIEGLLHFLAKIRCYGNDLTKVSAEFNRGLDEGRKREKKDTEFLDYAAILQATTQKFPPRPREQRDFRGSRGRGTTPSTHQE